MKIALIRLLIASVSFLSSLNVLGIVTCPDDFEVSINDPGFLLTGGIPDGGEYTGPSVAFNIFSPIDAGVGTHLITYTFEGESCNFNITVTPAGITVTCPDDFEVSVNDPGFLLTGGLPEGGEYTGPGVAFNIFSPIDAGVGTHLITYTFEGESCNFNITVTPAGITVTCPDDFEVSVNDPGFLLTGGLPEGGEYTGPGVAFNIFSPIDAGVGTHLITYTFEGESCNFNITVTPAGITVTCPDDFEVSVNDPGFLLTGGLPEGGEYTGPGVAFNIFSPIDAGVGTHLITYTFEGESCNFNITVTPAGITVTCPDDFEVSVNDPGFLLTGGLPEGGEYTGPGVAFNIFSPADAGVGTHLITYTFEGESCNFNITVTPAGITVTCPDDFEVSVNDPGFLLTGGLPEGGEYTGPGVAFNIFSPIDAGVGTHLITYTFEGESCNFNITVTPAGITVTCPDDFEVSVNDPGFLLTGGLPEGGEYTGPGVAFNIFSPIDAGVGTHLITYTFEGESCNFNITVTPAGITVTCPDDFEVSVNDPGFLLTGGLPEGGEYAGPSVAFNIFSPIDAGVGTHLITYTFEGESCNFNITVTPAGITVTCPDDFEVSINDPGFLLTGGMPEGGEYTGSGVAFNIFSPADAGVGTHLITYTVEDESCVFNITIANGGPSITCPSDTLVIENDKPFLLRGGLPVGGEYSGAGVNNNFFDPGSSGPGNIIITYTVNQESCNFTITVTSSSGSIICPNDMIVCRHGDGFLLTGGYPDGGDYSGPGVAFNIFSPADADVGTHLITYTVEEESCSFRITVIGPAEKPTLISNDSVVCRLETKVYQASPIEYATQYFWSMTNTQLEGFATNEPEITITFTDDFNSGNLTVRAANQCYSQDQGTVSDNLFIRVNPLPQSEIIGKEEVCKNEVVMYSSSSSLASYQWLVSEEDGVIVGPANERNVRINWNEQSENGVINLNMINSEGCSSDTLLQITKANSAAPIPSEIWRFGHNLLVASDSAAGITYQWYYSGTGSNIISTRQYLYVEDVQGSGSYYVRTCFDLCCNDSETYSFNKDAALETYTENQNFLIGPVPARDYLSVINQIPVNVPFGYVVYDIYGRPVKKGWLEFDKTELNVSSFSPGIYFLRVLLLEAGVKETHKFIIY